MKSRILIAVLLSIFFVTSQAQTVYPTNWFVGMKDNTLQLMIHQENISNKLPMYKLSPAGMKLADGVTLKMIQRVENPNYVFLDLVIDKNAKPGKRNFTFGSGGNAVTISYELLPRHAENGKSRVLGISSKDFIYLMMPDRFSNGDPSNDVITEYRDQSFD